MATPKAAFASPLEFLHGLMQQRELVPRAKIVADAIALTAAPDALIIYSPRELEADWLPRLIRGEVELEERSVAKGTGIIARVERDKQPVVFIGSQLPREDYAHLNIRRTVASLAYIPFVHDGNLVAFAELINYERPANQQELNQALVFTHYASAALADALDYEQERNDSLASISRLTQLYDLEHVFNSTLQMDRLLPLITDKVRGIMEVQAVNLWMVQGGDLLLMNRSGIDPTIEVGEVRKSGESIANEAIDTNKTILITKRDDPRIVKRNGDIKDHAIFSIMASPIISQKFGVGVMEVINRDNGHPFSEDSFYILSTLLPTVANALHNASLFDAERKLEVLETLVEVSREITSSLNMDRTIQIVVNGPQKIMAYDRAAVALEHHGKMQLKALSGHAEINTADPGVKELRSTLEWASHSSEEIYVTKRGNEVIADREETRLKFEEYFKKTGMRAFYCVPLQDEQGLLGVLSFESRNPDFLMDMHFELIKVLASQTSVALRNASLYTEVPFIGVLEPLLHKKHQFLAMEGRRQKALIALAIAVAIFLAVFPLPMRVVGDATVAPEMRSKIQTPVEGIVKRVYVREGDAVKAGTLIADLEDWDFRTQLAAAEAKHATAVAAMNRALASKDGSEAGIRKLEADMWAAEVARAKERLDRTHLRSSQDGVVATPRVDELVGKKLDVGDEVAEVVNTSNARVDIAIEEDDMPLLENGSKAAVKLDSFPTRKFVGTVDVVSPVSSLEGDRKVFYARATVPNEDGTLRPGMQGRGKVSAGWRPAGYVLFRGAGMWAWAKLWSWFGW